MSTRRVRQTQNFVFFGVMLSHSIAKRMRNLDSKRFAITGKVAFYDPRFLVFEFTWNLLLRARQVRSFVRSSV